VGYTLKGDVVNKREAIARVESEMVEEIIDWVFHNQGNEIVSIVRRFILDVTGTREEFMERYSSHFSDEERGK
jgi:hypothetical protein